MACHNTVCEECVLKSNHIAHLQRLELSQSLVRIGITDGVNTLETEAATVLMKAVRNGHDKCVEVLLRAGTDVNIKDTLGFTALMHA